MKATRIIVVCALAIAVVVMAVFCVKSVTTPIKFENTRVEREAAVIKHLVDLRTAEVEFQHQNGRFTTSYDTLLHFLKTAPKKEVLKEGSLTDKQLEAGMTEHKAVKIIEKAKAKAMSKLKTDDQEAIYEYIWANDRDIKDAGLQEGKKYTKKPEYLKPFEYHCAHSYWAYTEVVDTIFGAQGREISTAVLQDFAAEYGQEMADKLMEYKDTNFNCAD